MVRVAKPRREVVTSGRTHLGKKVARRISLWEQAGDLAVGAVREWFSPRALGWPARSAAGLVQVARGLKFAAAVAASYPSRPLPVV